MSPHLHISSSTGDGSVSPLDLPKMSITYKGDGKATLKIDVLLSLTTWEPSKIYFWNVYPKFNVKHIEYDITYSENGE